MTSGQPGLPVDPDSVGAYRQRVTHLVGRLPAGSYGAAAAGGLQDSSPRSALLSLHARLEGIGPSAWQHPSVAQLWFRWADYLVARADLGVFTLGTLPRDRDRRRRLEAAADSLLEVLEPEGCNYEEIVARRPNLAAVKLRALASTGKVLIRWDASTVRVLPNVPPGIDEEDARVELARRFLHWLGPGDARQFARWAGVTALEAAETFRVLRPELVAVAVGPRSAWMLAADEAALRTPPEFRRAVRFVPPGDPYLYPHAGMAVPAPPTHLAARPATPDLTRRLLNSLSGRLLLDGELAGSWGRAATTVTVAPWRPLDAGETDRVREEAGRLSGPMGRAVALRWLQPGAGALEVGG